MRTWKAPPPNLFEPQRAVVDLPPLQRAAALKLLEALLKESLSPPVAQGVPAIAQEADHDEDHA